MSLGIECLITDDEARAANCARELDRLNAERRRLEGDMLETALEKLKAEGDQGEDVAMLVRFIEQSERGVIK